MTVPGYPDMTPEDWRDRLVYRLLTEQPENLRRIAWYLGRQSVPVVPSDYRPSYALLLSQSLNPWARLIVDAIAERVALTGVRLDSLQADLDVWRLLKANHIDVDQRLVHSEALTLGTSYYSVWWGQRGLPVSIVPESGFQVTHEQDPADRRKTLVALKLWRDTISQKVLSILYMPGEIHHWIADLPEHEVQPAPTSPEHAKDFYKWEPWIKAEPEDREEGTVGNVVPNPLDRPPIVALQNRPTLFAWGQSEIDDLEPVLRRVDKLTLDLLLAAEVGAFRQKWATGLEVPVDPETNEPVEVYDAAIRKLWVADSEGARFGDFNATDLGPYLKAIEAQVAELSAVSRVPSYYLVSPNLVNPPSAETLRAADAGLINKVEALTGYWGEAYEEVVRLALDIMDVDSDFEPGTMTSVWKDPAIKSEAAAADAAVKWQEVGVPQQVLWERAGATPEEVQRWTTLNAQQRLANQALAGATTVDQAGLIGDAQVEDEPALEGAET